MYEPQQGVLPKLITGSLQGFSYIQLLDHYELWTAIGELNWITGMLYVKMYGYSTFERELTMNMLLKQSDIYLQRQTCFKVVTKLFDRFHYGVDAEIQYRHFRCVIGEVMPLSWTTASVYSDSPSFPSALSHWFNSTCDLSSCRSAHPPVERRDGFCSRFSLTGFWYCSGRY